MSCRHSHEALRIAVAMTTRRLKKEKDVPGEFFAAAPTDFAAQRLGAIAANSGAVVGGVE